MSITEELERLQKLKEQGTINEEEFQKAKQSILKEEDNLGKKIKDSVEAISLNENRWGMLIHLSLILPLCVIGAVLSVIIWQTKKEGSTLIDQHGKAGINWFLSMLLYFFLAYLISLFIHIIGLLLTIAVGFCAVLFPILAAIQANDGVVWHYPGGIGFFK